MSRSYFSVSGLEGYCLGLVHTIASLGLGGYSLDFMSRLYFSVSVLKATVSVLCPYHRVSWTWRLLSWFHVSTPYFSVFGLEGYCLGLVPLPSCLLDLEATVSVSCFKTIFQCLGLECYCLGLVHTIVL